MQIIRQHLFIGFIGIFLLLTGAVAAFEVAVEFSAEAVQRAPMSPEYHAKMYVSKDAVRTESTINDIAVVEIVNIKEQNRILFVSKEKIYMQQQRPSVDTTKDISKSPCAKLPGTTCKKLGSETLNDRRTEKWEFSVERNGQPLRSLHWIDIENRMPIREFYPDGTVTEMTMQGKEDIQGRKTEKWAMTIMHSDGQSRTSMQWYDPELKIAIREEMEGGFIRELRNIKTGKQDRQLFYVPAGYTQVDELPAYLMSPPRAAGYPGK